MVSFGFAILALALATTPGASAWPEVKKFKSLVAFGDSYTGASAVSVFRSARLTEA